MADNLKQTKQNIDQAINPGAPVGGILAQNHNNVLSEVLSKVGRYVGAPFLSIKTGTGGVIPSGNFSWNNNAMNNTNEFVITLSKYTADGNNIGRILNTLADGDLIHFKDYVGRSVYLIYKNHAAGTDTNNNDVFDVAVEGLTENTSHTYGATEMEPCIIEFYPLKGAVSTPEQATPWSNISLLNGTTALRARYRKKGDTVEVELYIIRQGSIHTASANIPPDGRPTIQIWTAGYNVSKTKEELFSIYPNGDIRFISTSTIGSDGCVLTVQYRIM